MPSHPVALSKKPNEKMFSRSLKTRDRSHSRFKSCVLNFDDDSVYILVIKRAFDIGKTQDLLCWLLCGIVIVHPIL